MPTNVSQLVVILLFVAPGVVYHNARSRALKRAGMETASLTREPLEVLAVMTVASTILSGLAVGSLLLFQRLLEWLDTRLDWISVDTSLLPSLKVWLEQGSDYVSEHWQSVVGSVAAAFVIALILARVLGSQRGNAAVYAEKYLRQQQLEVSRSRAVVRLKSGTIYSGIIPSQSGQQSIVGEELVLFAPINVKTAGGTRILSGGVSITLARSEIASLTLADGTVLLPRNRHYLFSDAVPPPWLRGD